MSKTMKMLCVNLRLFDGGAGDGAGADAGTGGAQAAQGEKTGEKVFYGKQPEAQAPAAGEQTGKPETETAVTSDALEERRARFREMISGEFKDMYDENVQSIVKRRVGDSKAMEQRLGAVTPVLELLAGKYGVKADDPAAIASAIEQDDTYWEEAAEEAGMTVEQFRMFKNMERENEQFRREQQRVQETRAVSEIQQKWAREAEALCAKYPAFDLEAECESNPEFVKLLANNVSVETAFNVIHMDEIVSGAVTTAAKRAEKNVTENIRTKGMRPPENGVSGSGGVVVKSDVSKLTRDDRAEIARRAARGENISF